MFRKTIGSITAAALLLGSGCAVLDKTVGNNDDKFDMPEVSLVWQDNFGNRFKVITTDANGIALDQVYYKSMISGLIYEKSSAQGSFIIRAEGRNESIRRVE